MDVRKKRSIKADESEDGDAVIQKQSAQIIMPLWMTGIVSGIILSVLGWTAQGLMESKNKTAVIEEKIRRLEDEHSKTAAIPIQIAEVKTELSAVRGELSALREDLRRKEKQK